MGEILARDEKAPETDVLKRYDEILTPAAMEVMDFKFKLAKSQRDLAADLEQQTWSRSHSDFFLKCLELLKRRPELIAEMRLIPVPSIPRPSNNPDGRRKGKKGAEP